MDPIKPEARQNWQSPYYPGFQRTIDTIKRNYDKIKYIPGVRNKLLFDGIFLLKRIENNRLIPEVSDDKIKSINAEIADDIQNSLHTVNYFGAQNDVHYNHGLTLLAAQDAVKSSSRGYKLGELLHGDFFTSMVPDPQHKKNALATLFRNMGTEIKQDERSIKSSIMSRTYNPFETIYDVDIPTLTSSKYLKNKDAGEERAWRDFTTYDANSSNTAEYIESASNIATQNFKAIAQNLKTMMEHQLRSRLGSQYHQSHVDGYLPKLTIFTPMEVTITKKTLNRDNTGFDYDTRHFLKIGIQRLGHGFLNDESGNGRIISSATGDDGSGNGLYDWKNDIQSAHMLFLVNQANKRKWQKTMRHFNEYLEKTVSDTKTNQQNVDKQQKEIGDLVTALKQQNQQLRDQQSQYSELFDQNQKTYNELIEQMKGLATNQYTNSMSGLEDLKDFPYNVRKNKLILGAMPSVENAGDFFAGYLNN